MATSEAVLARQVAEIHRLAQERLGLSAAISTVSAWQQVSPLAPSPGGWVNEIWLTVRAIRTVSARLAGRYYTLARAISTGYGLPDFDGQRAGSTVSMGQLYTEFASVLNEVIEATVSLPDVETPAMRDESQDDPVDTDLALEARVDEIADQLLDAFQSVMPDADDPEWVKEIPVDTDWQWDELERLLNDSEDEVREDLLADLAEALDDLEQKINRQIADDTPMQEAMQRIDDFTRVQGAKAAASADQQAIQPGRDLVVELGARDGRRYGWMRVTGPRPCAFCSMLASRGAVYDSKQSATFTERGGFNRLYHPNCHCSAIPVWTDEPAYSARDQYFIDSWTPATRGASGKAALRQWRRWLASQYRQELVPDQDVFGPARPSETE